VDESKSEPPKVKVVDRRKFTADGDPLEPAAPGVKSSASASPSDDPAEVPRAAPKKVQPTPPPATEGQSPPSQRFLELVTMLAAQAELLLVGTDDLAAQPEEAQRIIDYLGVLEEKTAGNLSNEEANVLSSVLYQLRTIFLQRK
jgi:hypothetical protein